MSIWDKVKKYANGYRILTEMVGPDGDVVNAELAQSRANICVKCPKHGRGGIVTKAVAWSIKEEVDLKGELGLVVSNEDDLKSCLFCNCPMRLKIWLPIGKIRMEQTQEEESAWPNWCWIKNEP